MVLAARTSRTKRGTPAMAESNITREALRAALPDLTRDIAVAGLDGAVSLYRDALGIPHVEAVSASDAFFGQGFAAAQDRLWQMDLDRHKAHGRSAEVLGPAALDADVLVRRLGLAASAQADYASVSPGARAMLDAYAAGVNAFLATTRSLPIEHRLLDLSPEPWLPWHCLSVFKIRHVFMGTFDDQAMAGARARQGRTRSDGAALPLIEAGRPRDHPAGRRVRGRGRGHRRAAHQRERRRTAGRGGLRRKRRRQQLVGAGRVPHRVGQAVARRRSAPRSRHPQRLLPEPHLMPRVRRDRPLLRRTARLPSLRPQPFRGLVRHPHRRRLSGPLRRALR